MHSQFLGGASNLMGYMAVNGWLRIPVPIFLLINGYFFQRAIARGKPVSAWFKHVALLYGVWMVIYAPIYLTAQSFTAEHLNETLLTFIFGYWHLWYLSAMLGAGVLLYAIRKLPSKQMFALLLTLSLIGLAIQYTRAYGDVDEGLLHDVIESNFTSRNSLFFALPFMGAGFLLARVLAERPELLNSSFWRKAAWIAAVGGMALMLWEAYTNFTELPDSPPRMDILLGSIIACPGLFWLTFTSRATIESDVLAKFSSALYFIHPWLVFGLAKYAPQIQNTPLTWTLTALSTVAAIVLMWVAKRAKFLL